MIKLALDEINKIPCASFGDHIDNLCPRLVDCIGCPYFVSLFFF